MLRDSLIPLGTVIATCRGRGSTHNGTVYVTQTFQAGFMSIFNTTRQ